MIIIERKKKKKKKNCSETTKKTEKLFSNLKTKNENEKKLLCEIIRVSLVQLNRKHKYCFTDRPDNSEVKQVKLIYSLNVNSFDLIVYVSLVDMNPLIEVVALEIQFRIIYFFVDFFTYVLSHLYNALLFHNGPRLTKPWDRVCLYLLNH